MIRINLLRNGFDPAAADQVRAVSGSFVSKREIVAGGLFLALGCVILATQVRVSEDVSAASTAAPLPIEEAVLVEQRPAESRSVESVPEPSAQPEESVAASLEPRLWEMPVAELIDARSIARDAAPGDVVPAEAEAAAEAAPARDDSTASAAAPAFDLTALRVEPRGDDLEIVLRAAGRPEIKTFRLDSPKRLVVDIPGARLSIPREEQDQTFAQAGVRRLRIAQNSFSPPLVRIVLEAVAFPEVEKSIDSETIRLLLRATTEE